MFEYLLNIDLSIFRFINQTLSNPLFDVLMPFITESKNWMPVYITAIFLLLWKGNFKGRMCVLVLAITILLSDQLASSVIKELVGRLRPCHTLLTDVRLLVACGGGKSFPSSHAVNNFAAAIIFSFFYRKYTAIFFIIASFVAISRVYVGVHYPSDILGGAIIGVIVATTMIYIYTKIIRKYRKVDNEIFRF